MAASCFDTISPNLSICPDRERLLGIEQRMRLQIEAARDFEVAVILAQLVAALQRARHAHEENCARCRQLEREIAA
jgi:hypothetical protein